MTDEQTNDMRIRQLEESVLRQEGEIGELRAEIETLGEVLVVAVSVLERLSPTAVLDELNQAAEKRGNDRVAQALESLVASVALEA